MERHSVSRLVGAPPGYVGYDEAGQLTEAVRRRPYSVILFDEIEKAHPEVFNILLQLMDDGRLTDAHGRTVDFRNTIALMTSNIGAQLIKRDVQLGFQVGGDTEQSEENRYKTMKAKVLSELKKAFRPEFLNRVDATVVFRSLTRADMMQIVELELRRVRAQVTEHEMELEMTPEAVALLVEKGYDPDFGARPLKRVIQTMVEDSLADHLLSGHFSPGEKIRVVRDGDELRAETREPVGA
jgi:ATP-dependent Clp protease ATP-binding subunit ClpC